MKIARGNLALIWELFVLEMLRNAQYFSHQDFLFLCD